MVRVLWAVLALLSSGPASALSSCGLVEKSLDGLRIVVHDAALRSHTDGVNGPTFGDGLNLSGNFPREFSVCWSDPRLRSYDSATMALLTSAETYVFDKLGDNINGVLLDPLAKSPALMRHKRRLYVLISPSLDEASARKAVLRHLALARECRSKLGGEDEGGSRVTLAGGQCAAPPFVLDRGPGLTALSSSGQQALALTHLRRSIKNDAPSPGRFESYCYTAEVGEYRKMVPEAGTDAAWIIDHCVVFGNDGQAREVRYDDPRDLADLVNFVRDDKAREQGARPNAELPGG